ncbi:MAG TPA: hypothetical protein DD706_19565, partial [Nitrospiraceae bacterium]|nr:hypothetical protein [Nitrospiraceae bacterium]
FISSRLIPSQENLREPLVFGQHLRVAGTSFALTKPKLGQKWLGHANFSKGGSETPHPKDGASKKTLLNWGNLSSNPPKKGFHSSPAKPGLS